MEVNPKRRERSASQASDSSDLAGIINNCSVCYNKYNEGKRLPKVLICGHTLCSSCVRQVISHTAKIQCPICRKETRTRLQDIPTNYQLLELLQKMGLLCRDRESRPTSPTPGDDLPAIEQELRVGLSSAVNHFGGVVDEILKEISDLGLDPAHVMPFRDGLGHRIGFHIMNPAPNVLESAQKKLTQLGHIFDELEGDVKSARRMKKHIDDTLANGLATVDANTKMLKFHRLENETEFNNLLDPVPVHEIPRYPLREARGTPPPQGFGGFGGRLQFFDDFDAAEWERQEVLFGAGIGPVSPHPPVVYGLDDDEYAHSDYETSENNEWDDHRHDDESATFSEPDYDDSLDDFSNSIVNYHCYLCDCQIPPDYRSRRIHIAGRRHRETKECNSIFLGRFIREADEYLRDHNDMREFNPNTSDRIDVPDSRPFRGERSRRNRGDGGHRGGGRGGGNAGSRFNQPGFGESLRINIRGRGNGRGAFRAPGGERGRGRGGRGRRVPQHDYDLPGELLGSLSFAGIERGYWSPPGNHW